MYIMYSSWEKSPQICVELFGVKKFKDSHCRILTQTIISYQRFQSGTVPAFSWVNMAVGVMESNGLREGEG